MMIKSAFIFLLLLLVMHTWAQNDTLTAKTHISLMDVFDNQLEKSIFTSIEAGKEVDDLTLFLASDPAFEKEADVKTAALKLNGFVENAKQAKGELKSKELKNLYKRIHQSFLNRYVENPVFGSIFSNGDYNCATATALYALVLNKLAIPFDIHETPEHVYIVAAPQSQSILFETTAPGAKILQINDKVKKQFVEEMYSNKLITKEEFENGDRNALFDKYYYENVPIHMRELAGLLYYNKGIDAVEKEEFVKAYKCFEKAAFLYPNERMQYFLTLTLMNIVYNASAEVEPGLYPFYLRLLDVSKQEIASTLLKEYMARLTEKLLFKSPDLAKYQTVYQAIQANVQDTALRNELQYMHRYEMAHFHHVKNELSRSMSYLDTLYRSDTANLLLHDLISQTVVDLLRKTPSELQALDTLKKYIRRFAFVDTNSELWDFYAYCMAKVASSHYDLERKKEGDQLLEEIKKVITTHPEFAKRKQDVFILAFNGLYSFYMRHAQYKDAKASLVVANKYIPNHDEIKRRMTTINSILN